MSMKLAPPIVKPSSVAGDMKGNRVCFAPRSRLRSEVVHGADCGERVGRGDTPRYNARPKAIVHDLRCGHLLDLKFDFSP